MRLAGVEPPDQEIEPLAYPDDSDIEPEIVTQGSPAWQRGLELSAMRRRN
jgi:hypothetical protein